MREIIFATKNNGKLKEIIEILAPYRVRSMTDAGIDIEIEENGKTFEENAVIKANAVYEAASEAGIKEGFVLADDSGIEIDYLDKAPGVYSARYLGEDTPYNVKNAKILEMLKGVPEEKRSARFVCAIAAKSFPSGEVVTKTACIEGFIANEARGENGFGYDPIFFVPEYGITTAEMSAAQKNAISHRALALRKIKELL